MRVEVGELTVLKNKVDSLIRARITKTDIHEVVVAALLRAGSARSELTRVQDQAIMTVSETAARKIRKLAEIFGAFAREEWLLGWLRRAEKVLGYDLWHKIALNAEGDLAQTRFCQPAMYVAGFLAAEALKQAQPERWAKCQAVAGIGVGEYSRAYRNTLYNPCLLRGLPR